MKYVKSTSDNTPEFVVIFGVSFTSSEIQSRPREAFYVLFTVVFLQHLPVSFTLAFGFFKNLHISCTYACKQKKGACIGAISPFSCWLMGFARINSPWLKGENGPFCVYLYRDVYMGCGGTLLNVNLPCQWKDWKVLCLFIHLYKSIYTRMYMCVYR